jgi:hypothetical protein
MADYENVFFHSTQWIHFEVISHLEFLIMKEKNNDVHNVHVLGVMKLNEN